jgi:exopolysaccharide biosynthesis WecB/TagA/CpsF family protein
MAGAGRPPTTLAEPETEDAGGRVTPGHDTGELAIRLLGLDFADLDATEAAALIAQRSPDAPFTYVVTPNADHLVRLARRPELTDIYQSAWLRLLDSRVVARAARWLRLPTPRVAPGSDLTALLIAAHLHRNESITIIGLRAAALPGLAQRYRLTQIAQYDPPMGFVTDPIAFQTACDFAVTHPARFTFLAVGSPQQELLAAAIAATGRAHGVGLCIGASLDFLAGTTQRAPEWMQRAGLEWLHRLASDPRRLARRYLLRDPMIFRLLLRERRARATRERRALDRTKTRGNPGAM